MNCAKCAAELTTEHVGGLDLQRCHECGGIFLESGQLRELVQDGAMNTVLETNVTKDNPMDSIPAHCPLCNTQMNRVKTLTAEMHLDVCPGHGLWLDEGELTTLDNELDNESHLIDVVAFRMARLSTYLKTQKAERKAAKIEQFDQERDAVLDLENGNLIGKEEVLTLLGDIDDREMTWKAKDAPSPEFVALQTLRNSGLISAARFGVLKGQLLQTDQLAEEPEPDPG